MYIIERPIEIDKRLDKKGLKQGREMSNIARIHIYDNYADESTISYSNCALMKLLRKAKFAHGYENVYLKALEILI